MQFNNYHYEKINYNKPNVPDEYNIPDEHLVFRKKLYNLISIISEILREKIDLKKNMQNI